MLLVSLMGSSFESAPDHRWWGTQQIQRSAGSLSKKFEPGRGGWPGSGWDALGSASSISVTGRDALGVQSTKRYREGYLCFGLVKHLLCKGGIKDPGPNCGKIR